MNHGPTKKTSVEEWIPEPRSIEDTELGIDFLENLALKLIYYRQGLSGTEISEALALPFFGVIEKVLASLKRQELAVVSGSTGYSEAGYQWIITNKGANRALQALERDRYVGPAPVPLERYNEMVRRQSLGDVTVRPADVQQAVSHLVLGGDLLSRLGPAVNSGRSLFLYGPAGNGKTTIAKSIIRMLQGSVYFPYSAIVDGQIIRIFDQVNHRRVNGASPRPQIGTARELDQRWVKIERPEIVVGGELVMSSLDLIYDPIAKTYDAPFQMKANTGLFVIDDFGRQAMRPQDLLNRWIVPLEMRVDFLTLRTGKKIETPFDQFVVFATNLDPRDLVDDAFLRRIRHKLKVDYPEKDVFYQIWQSECSSRGLESPPDAFNYLMRQHYMAQDRELRSCHPRDLLDSLLDIATYLGVRPELSQQLIDAACETYFSEI